MNAHGQVKRSPAYHDLDKMPFGKFKDVILQDVAPSYLIWLYGSMRENGVDLIPFREGLPFKDQQNIKLFNYIHNSMEAIEMELENE